MLVYTVAKRVYNITTRLLWKPEGPCVEPYRLAYGWHRARTAANVGVYGCDAIQYHPHPTSIESPQAFSRTL
jgi:hypothetical protein